MADNFETYQAVDGDEFDQILAQHYKLTATEGGEAALINNVWEYVVNYINPDNPAISNQNISRKPTFPILNLGDVFYLPELPDEMFKTITTGEQVEIFNVS